MNNSLLSSDFEISSNRYEKSNPSSTVFGLNYFINYLNLLEGAKTKVKNLHWSSKGLNIHIKLDEFLDIISDFQDLIAEETMGIYGQIDPNIINGIKWDQVDPIAVLDDLKYKTNMVYTALGNDISFIGIKSNIEVFISNINKYKFLFSICKG